MEGILSIFWDKSVVPGPDPLNSLLGTSGNAGKVQRLDEESPIGEYWDEKGERLKRERGRRRAMETSTLTGLAGVQAGKKGAAATGIKNRAGAPILDGRQLQISPETLRKSVSQSAVTDESGRRAGPPLTGAGLFLSGHTHLSRPRPQMKATPPPLIALVFKQTSSFDSFDPLVCVHQKIRRDASVSHRRRRLSSIIDQTGKTNTGKRNLACTTHDTYESA